MAPKRAYGVDWEPYREEIISLYVKQNQTAEATVKYLEERHGLRVTYVLWNIHPYLSYKMLMRMI